MSAHGGGEGGDIVQMMPPDGTEKIDKLAFSTLNGSLQESSSDLMQYVRTTLQRAQEIANVVDEAEAVSMEAGKFAQEVTKEKVSRESEKARKEAAAKKEDKARVAEVTQEAEATENPEIRTTGRAEDTDREPWVPNPEGVATGLTKEIQVSVMWVQQLLEFVSYAESKEPLEPGANLKTGSSLREGVCKPNRVTAIERSGDKYHEKKEDEVEAEGKAGYEAVFRERAIREVQDKMRQERAGPGRHH